MSALKNMDKTQQNMSPVDLFYTTAFDVSGTPGLLVQPHYALLDSSTCVGVNGAALRQQAHLKRPLACAVL